MTWFIFRTAPQKEIIARDILKKIGFEVYLPVAMRYRFSNRYARHRKQKTLREFPLMIGYIFIAMERDKLGEFFARRSVYGLFNCVKSVVGVGGGIGVEPYAIDDGVMQDLMREHGEGKHTAPDSHKHMLTHKEFKVGDTVRVVEGPFREFDVTVDSIDGNNLRVFFDIFGRKNKTEMPLDYVERII